MRNNMMFVLVLAVAANLACDDRAAKYPVENVSVDGGTPTFDDAGVTIVVDGGTPLVDGGSVDLASCTNTAQDGNETDVDCGGSCATCAEGKKCVGWADCESGVCDNNACTAQQSQSGPTCSDSIRNGNETDVDCGGSCSAKCANGFACAIDNDCVANFCSGGRCAVRATCSDSVENNSESDIDCGGSCSAKCANGKKCSLSADCQSGICAGGTCVPPNTPPITCNANSTKDGNETDVDCGGNACGPCADSRACEGPDDCSSDRCSFGICEATTSNPVASCTNSRRDGSESDVDCGGSCPLRCMPNQACVYSSDCASGSCNIGRCAAPTSTIPAVCDATGTQNGDETDIDCGGGVYDNNRALVSGCGACVAGKKCRAYTDCLSLACTEAGGTSTCNGPAIVPVTPVITNNTPSGSFTLLGSMTVVDCKPVIHWSSTERGDINILRYMEGRNDVLTSGWKSVEVTTPAGGTIPLNVTGPTRLSVKLHAHSASGVDAESAMFSVDIPACPSVTGGLTNGMSSAGARCQGHIDCASKYCDRGVCSGVSTNPSATNYIIEGVPNQAGPVNIRVLGPSVQVLNGLTATVSIPTMCDPNYAGYRGLNEYIVVCGVIAGRGWGMVQIRGPGSFGTIWGEQYSGDGSCAAFHYSQLGCGSHGYPAR